ncbi:MAG: helix-turn-helix transcriptional regulator [Actinobacteria bacterium]|nr:helix-turn-helix transcriptional regulator [Actinomycetota bacterium]
MRTYIRDEDVDRNVAVVLKMLCAARGVSMVKVARDLHMSESALRERVSGKRRFTAAEVVAFARYLKVRPGRFFEPAISESESAWRTVSAGQQTFPAQAA